MCFNSWHSTILPHFSFTDIWCIPSKCFFVQKNVKSTFLPRLLTCFRQRNEGFEGGNFGEFLKQAKARSDCNWTWSHNHLIYKRTLNHLAKLANWLSCVVSTYLYSAFDLCSYHVMYAFQSESTLYSCLNVKELLAQSRCKIWSLSDCNWTRTHNHLVHKWTLSHLAKLAKWLSCFVSTYLYGAFDCMFLSCHVCVSEWIHTL